jgi:hypothetical protein
MKIRLVIAGVAMVAGASVAGAQCSNQSADACRKATDLVQFLAPQFAAALASGNPTLGQGGTLGGLGHFAIDLRASAVNGTLPKMDNIALSITGQKASVFTGKDSFIPAASADAAIGLYRGVSLGVTHVGGLDALVTMTYLPTLPGGDVGSADVNVQRGGSSTKFGFGARIGIIEESLVTPGIAFAYVKRDLPEVSASGTITATLPNLGGTIALNNFAVKTTVWRLTAAKSFFIFGLSGGYGQDKYEATSTVTGTVSGGLASGTTPANVSMTRTNYFGSLSINLFLFKVVGEYGQVSGGSSGAAINTFGTAADKSRSYYTAGLRFGR